MTVGLRRPPNKPSDLSRVPPAGAGEETLRGYVEELGRRLDMLWEWAQDQYLASQNPSGLSVSSGGGLPGTGAGGAEDAEILALYALMRGGC